VLDGGVELAHPLVFAAQLGRELVGENARRGVVARLVQLGLEARDLRLERADLTMM
jgi:hypothetical protein